MNQSDVKPGVYNKFRNQPEDELEERITNYLHNIGIPSHIKGYTYIREGISLIYNNPKRQKLNLHMVFQYYK